MQMLSAGTPFDHLGCLLPKRRHADTRLSEHGLEFVGAGWKIRRVTPQPTTYYDADIRMRELLLCALQPAEGKGLRIARGEAAKTNSAKFFPLGPVLVPTPWFHS